MRDILNSEAHILGMKQTNCLVHSWNLIKLQPNSILFWANAHEIVQCNRFYNAIKCRTGRERECEVWPSNNLRSDDHIYSICIWPMNIFLCARRNSRIKSKANSTFRNWMKNHNITSLSISKSYVKWECSQNQKSFEKKKSNKSKCERVLGHNLAYQTYFQLKTDILCGN